MCLDSLADYAIHLRKKGPHEFRVCPLDHCCKVVAFPFNWSKRVFNKLLEHSEIIIVLARHPQGLCLAEECRRIIRSYVKCFIIISERSGIIVH